MKRRGFLGRIIGVAGAAAAAQSLPIKADPQAVPLIASPASPLWDIKVTLPAVMLEPHYCGGNNSCVRTYTTPGNWVNFDPSTMEKQGVNVLYTAPEKR